MKTLAEKIKVMQAAQAGKSIQTRNSCDEKWGHIDHPKWNWAVNDYRVTPPVPREFWINRYEHNQFIYNSKTEAYHKRASDRRELIHVREVLQDEGPV